MITIQFPKWLEIRNGWTSNSYRWVRIILGVYLMIHFAHLVPWAAELFSNQGSLPDSSVSPFAYLFPNVLTFFDSPQMAIGVVSLGALASLALTLGVKDRWMAVLIWVIWASLFGRNPLISNPSLAFVGWMLLFHAFLPKRDDAFRVPDSMYGSAWWVMAAGYTYSGYTKLISPSWLDGTAITHVLMSPLARLSPLRDLLLELPAFLKLLTWGTLGIELLALPIALISRARPWLWLALVGLHIGIICTVSFADLSLGMLMIHALTFNPSWVSRPRALQEKERPATQRSHGCTRRGPH